MKRILLSVLAAAVTAAWAMPAPATATDFSFDGQYRVRGEFRDNADFDADDGDTTSSYGQRVRLTTNAQVNDDTSVKITLQDTRTWGSDQSTNGGPNLTDDGSNTLDLHESYLQVDNLFDSPVGVRVGRQELVYGDQRLIGSFGWHNNGRSFDAVKFMYGSEMVDVDFWTSKINENNATTTAGGVSAGDADQDFYGAYATVKSVPNNTIDVYAMLLRDGSITAMVANNTAIGAANKPQTLWTYGARLKGNLEDLGIDYTGELAAQTGTIETATTDYDIGAYAVALKAGYTLPTAFNLRVGAEYDYASGDDNSGDTDIETFSNLFPTNHGHYGYADQQGLRNVSAWNVNAKADVNEQLSLYAAYWMFSLAEEADGWYGAGNWMTAPGGIRTASATNTTDEVGSEIDLVANYKYNDAVSVQAGYSRFLTGDFIDNQVTNTEDQDFAYLMLTGNF